MHSRVLSVTNWDVSRLKKCPCGSVCVYNSTFLQRVVLSIMKRMLHCSAYATELY